MAVNVLIAGAGQLGSRYLQGLSKFDEPASIWVFDIAEESLTRARERWSECDCQLHTVSFERSLEKIPSELDMAFVTTSSNVRVAVVGEIAKVSSVRYWVLEKVLAQNIQKLHELQSLTVGCAGAWVNTPMYLWPLYRKLKENSDTTSPIEAYFMNMRGLACNAIHYIDFVSRWAGAKIISIDTDGLNRSWVPSKREGFMEVEGRLLIAFSDGSKLILTGSEHAGDYTIKVNTSTDCWLIDESSSLATSAGYGSVKAPILRQSEVTAPLLHDVLTMGKCDLPSLESSVEQHKYLIEALLAHWNSNMPTRLDYVPFT